MNGNLIVEQSKLLAERAKQEAGGALDEQVRLMFMYTLGRAPKAEELAISKDLATSDELSSVGRMLFNLNEFFYLN